jgi:lipopolysaccharide export system permease protein
MELPVAWDYLQKIQNYDHTEYNTLATDFYQRLFSCLTPFVLMLIACSINYRFKKNVLLFSIICCLCIGVIYYVVQMLSLIMANQGMISPMAGMLVPFALILVLSLGMTSTFRT